MAVLYSGQPVSDNHSAAMLQFGSVGPYSNVFPSSTGFPYSDAGDDVASGKPEMTRYLQNLIDKW